MIHLSELLFLGGFLVFIVAILVVDMLVIDRKAHAVSIKEAGTWTAVWITLALAFSAFLWFHGDMVHGIHNFADLQAVAGKYAAHINLDPNDFEGSLQKYRHYMTVSYISGYLIEKTLSVDNLFVMMMIFASFGVGKEEYQHVLNWGILGAIVLRFVFISVVSIGFCICSELFLFIVRQKCFSNAIKKKTSMWRNILSCDSFQNISVFTRRLSETSSL